MDKKIKDIRWWMCFSCLILVFLFTSFSSHAGSFKLGNYDLNGSRSIPLKEERKLNMQDVKERGLEIKWHADTIGWVASVPIVDNGVVYVGTNFNLDGATGFIYAFDGDDGSEIWKRPIPGGVLASPLIKGQDIYIASFGGYDASNQTSNHFATLYKLKKKTGKIVWQFPAPNAPDPIMTTRDSIWTGPIHINNGEKNLIILGINANDEAAPQAESGVVAVDANTGIVEWEFFTSGPGEGGSGVWETSPAFSMKHNLIFVTTGQTSQATIAPPFFGSNAVFAINASDGSLAWRTQMRDDDFWNFSVPFDPTDPLDTDIGAGATLFKMNGREHLGIATKRGYFHVLDAASGVILNNPNSPTDATGAARDALGFVIGLDGFNGGDPITGVIGNSTDGGYSLESGYYQKGGEVIHFGVLFDYTDNMKDVANQVPPYTNGTCMIFFPPSAGGCPGINFGHLVLINSDGSAELGRLSVPNSHIFSPVYLDGLIYLHANETLPGQPGAGINNLLVVDVSDPTNPTLLQTIPLTDPVDQVSASSGGATVSVGNSMIYTGNGFFGFSKMGVFAIGLKDDDN